MPWLWPWPWLWLCALSPDEQRTVSLDPARIVSLNTLAVGGLKPHDVCSRTERVTVWILWDQFPPWKKGDAERGKKRLLLRVGRSVRPSSARRPDPGIRITCSSEDSAARVSFPNVPPTSWKLVSGRVPGSRAGRECAR